MNYNYFYDLPDDLREKIHIINHKAYMNEICKIINHSYCNIRKNPNYYFYDMTLSTAKIKNMIYWIENHPEWCARFD